MPCPATSMRSVTCAAMLPISGWMPEILVDRLKSEMAARGSARDSAIDRVPLSERKLAQGGTVIKGLLLVALIYSGYQVFASAGRTSEPPVLPVPARLAAEAGLAQNTGCRARRLRAR